MANLIPTPRRAPPPAGQAEARGFTLIELLVVMGVLAILGTIAAPSMRDLIVTQRVRATASDLHLTLVRARSEAIKRNRSVTVSRSGSDWNGGWNVVDPVNSSAPALYTVSVPGGISVTDSPATESVVYGSNGKASAVANFVVTSVSGPGATRCVSIELTGRPYIKDGSSC